MSKINRHNYEAYLLDWQEGNLSEEDQAQLRVFLANHPELAAGLKEDGLVYLPEDAEGIDFQGKSDLKITVTPTDQLNADNYEDWFVRSAEQELTDSEQQELSVFLDRNAELQKDHQLFGLTRLTPEQVTYPDKEALKRKSGVLIPLHAASAWRVAASVAVLIAVGAFWFSSTTSTDEGLAIFEPRNVSGLEDVIDNAPSVSSYSDKSIEKWIASVQRVREEGRNEVVHLQSVDLGSSSDQVKAGRKVKEAPISMPLRENQGKLALEKPNTEPILSDALPNTDWLAEVAPSKLAEDPKISFRLPRSLWGQSNAAGKRVKKQVEAEVKRWKRPFQRIIRFEATRAADGTVESWELVLGPLTFYRNRGKMKE